MPTVYEGPLNEGDNCINIAQEAVNPPPPCGVGMDKGGGWTGCGGEGTDTTMAQSEFLNRGSGL